MSGTLSGEHRPRGAGARSEFRSLNLGSGVRVGGNVAEFGTEREAHAEANWLQELPWSAQELEDFVSVGFVPITRLVPVTDPAATAP